MANLKTLDNGMRIATDTVHDVESVVLGFFCDVGSRFETPEVNGIAHFFEHMMFKGTPTRNTHEIVSAVEGRGGRMNAFTGRDITGYFVHVLKEDLRLGFDVLAEMVRDATFPESEIDQEREVVVQEICMYEDTPDDIIFDRAQENLYPNQAMGRPILGTTETVRSFTRDTLVQYRDTHMCPQNIVVSAAGNVESEELEQLCEDYFKNSKNVDRTTPDKASFKGGDLMVDKDVEQAHILLNWQGLDRHHDDFYAMKILSTALGGGMSSRLFQEIREKRGLAYSVYSFDMSYADTGTFGIYAGTDNDKLDDTVNVSIGEIEKAANGISTEELAKAKAQNRASVLFGRESLMKRAQGQARRLLTHNELPDIDKTLARIEGVSMDDIARVAQNLANSKVSKTILRRKATA